MVTFGVFIGILAFMVGRAYEKWTSGLYDVEELAFTAGYEKGYDVGYHDGETGKPMYFSFYF